MRNIWIIIYLMVLASFLQAVSIYDIQYTDAAGNGNYPSPLAGTIVTTQGIVTATHYSGSHGYYISMPEGGAWKGILIYDSVHSPVVGDLIEVTGQAWEFYGLTEIRSITAFTIMSSGNPVPPPAIVSSAMASTEAYEGVLMRVQDVTVSQAMNQYNEWYVNDGTGEVEIADALFDMTGMNAQTGVGILYDSITGVGNYAYSTHSLNPRTAADIVINSEGVIVTLPTLTTSVNAQLTVAVNVSPLTTVQNLSSYAFQLSYDPSVLSYVNYNTMATLSTGGTVTVDATQGNLGFSFTITGLLLGQGALLYLDFNAVGNGVSPLIANNFTFNNEPVMLINQGSVTVTSSSGEVVDTLSVIQKPLLNIPAIVLPGESFNIECVAATTTTGWAAWLNKGNLSYSLPIMSSQYVSDPPRWLLTAEVPNVNVFELYDLRVTANGGINDRTRHSVQVLPTRKANYYFAQITDSHMPSHIFYPDAGWDTDSTETVDLREVINDLNILRPEFVLMTGDLVNQGDLEDFQNHREYTKGKRLLGEFDVPVYMVAGNHDIGGWSDPPLPSGTARKNWWKNFGWSWLNNTTTTWPYHTQDYSFDYGPVHYVGLEAYDNYDNYLTSVYGSNSFTAGQLQWLQADLSASSAETKVLFQHYDFDGEINMGTLNLDMNLWGHIHSDSGSIYTQPYNLATDAVCDGGRAYRIVRVTGTSLTPYATLHAGSTGSQVRVEFIPNNYGLVDSVRASVINNQPLAFENALVKFKMPSGTADYTVTGGILEQVDTSGSFNICYVRVNLPASGTATVTIAASTSPAVDPWQPSPVLDLAGVYPNPFRDSITFNINLAKATALNLSIFNLKGELVRTVFSGKASGNNYYQWDGFDQSHRISPNGIYLYKLSGGQSSLSGKIILIK